MRINLDNLVKSKLILFLVIGFIYLLLISLVSFLALPHTFRTINPIQQHQGTNLADCNNYLKLQNKSKVICNRDNISTTNSSQNTSDLQRISFGNYVQHIDPLYQFVIFYFQLNNPFSDRLLNMNKTVLMTFKLFKTITNDSQIYLKNSSQVQQQWTRDFKELIQKYKDGYLYLGYISAKQDDDYYWQVSFNNTEIFINQTNSYKLTASTLRRQFSIFVIVIRVVLFVFSLLSCIKFCYKIRVLSENQITIEQRLIRVLSILTVVFNDILYFLTVLYPITFTAFLNTFYIWNYIFFLFVIWVIFLNRIFYNEPQNITNQFTKIKIILFVAYYLINFIFLLVYAVSKYTYHPIRQSNDAYNKSFVLVFFAALAQIFGAIYVIFLYVKICKIRYQLLWRYKIFFGISIIFFILTIIFFFNGSYDIYQTSAPKIMFSLCTLTFFSIFLQYAYTPTQQQIQEYNREQPKLKRDQAKQYLLNENRFNEDAVIQLEDYSLFQEDVETLTQKSQSKDKKQLSIRQRKRNRQKQSQKQKSFDKSSQFADEKEQIQQKIVISSNESGDIINDKF